jgi:hypothetical protein
MQCFGNVIALVDVQGGCKKSIWRFWCIFEVHLKFVVLEIRLHKNIFLIESAVKMKRWRVLLPIILLQSTRRDPPVWGLAWG